MSTNHTPIKFAYDGILKNEPEKQTTQIINETIEKNPSDKWVELIEERNSGIKNKLIEDYKGIFPFIEATEIKFEPTKKDLNKLDWQLKFRLISHSYLLINILYNQQNNPVVVCYMESEEREFKKMNKVLQFIQLNNLKVVIQ